MMTMMAITHYMRFFVKMTIFVGLRRMYNLQFDHKEGLIPYGQSFGFLFIFLIDSSCRCLLIISRYKGKDVVVVVSQSVKKVEVCREIKGNSGKL